MISILFSFLALIVAATFVSGVIDLTRWMIDRLTLNHRQELQREAARRAELMSQGWDEVKGGPFDGCLLPATTAETTQPITPSCLRLPVNH